MAFPFFFLGDLVFWEPDLFVLRHEGWVGLIISRGLTDKDWVWDGSCVTRTLEAMPLIVNSQDGMNPHVKSY